MKIEKEEQSYSLRYYYKHREEVLRKLREKRAKERPDKIRSKIVKLKKILGEIE